MNRVTHLAMVFIVIIMPSVVSAADCFSSLNATNHALYNSFGTFGTKGAAINSVHSCAFESGFYGELFTAAPLRDFDSGKEIDLRAGYRHHFDVLSIDVSGASYTFGVGAGKVQQAFNMRGKASTAIPLGKFGALSPYAGGDLNWNTSTDKADHAAFGGVGWTLDLTPILHLNVDGALWHRFTATPGLSHDIYSASAGLTWDVTNRVSVTPSVLYTHRGGAMPRADNASVTGTISIKW